MGSVRKNCGDAPAMQTPNNQMKSTPCRLDSVFMWRTKRKGLLPAAGLEVGYEGEFCNSDIRQNRFLMNYCQACLWPWAGLLIPVEVPSWALGQLTHLALRAPACLLSWDLTLVSVWHCQIGSAICLTPGWSALLSAGPALFYWVPEWSCRTLSRCH